MDPTPPLITVPKQMDNYIDVEGVLNKSWDLILNKSLDYYKNIE